MRTVGTQIDSSGPAETEFNAEVEGAKNSIKSRSDLKLNDAVGNQNQADSTLDLVLIKKELRRQRWRESNKRLSAYLADPESQRKRDRRLQDQRERTSSARKKLTESEKMEVAVNIRCIKQKD